MNLYTQKNTFKRTYKKQKQSYRLALDFLKLTHVWSFFQVAIIDPFQNVYEMRKQRCKMIQKPIQYHYLFRWQNPQISPGFHQKLILLLRYSCLYCKEFFIPRKGIVRPQSQFPHSCVCERSIYFHDWSTYFPAAEQADQSWEYINRSQTHEPPQFLFWEYLFRIFDIVSLQCAHKNFLHCGISTPQGRFEFCFQVPDRSGSRGKLGLYLCMNAKNKRQIKMVRVINFNAEYAYTSFINNIVKCS